MLNKYLKPMTTVACLLAFFVIVLGAYTRLTNAGLGCPDWPGCYGHLSGADAPEPVKAWTEMIHRYCAGTLVLLILSIAITCIRLRKTLNVSIVLPIALIALVIFQALLGLWTVSLKLWPIVVMAHLLGGIILLSLLFTVRMSLSQSARTSTLRSALLPWAYLSLLIVILQIALGGWVSSNYAGISCIGFPACNGVWWPSMQWSAAFSWLSIGDNYQGGLLTPDVRMTIQMVHRLGALITTLAILALAYGLWRQKQDTIARRLAIFLLLALVTQVTLGIINVIYLLPLHAAVLHNAGAVLLLNTVVATVIHTMGQRGAEHV